MKFEDAIPLLKNGEKLTRWPNPNVYIFYLEEKYPMLPGKMKSINRSFNGKVELWEADSHDILSEDWRIFQENSTWESNYKLYGIETLK